MKRTRQEKAAYCRQKAEELAAEAFSRLEKALRLYGTSSHEEGKGYVIEANLIDVIRQQWIRDAEKLESEKD